MTSTTRSATVPPTARRVARALGSALVVAVAGTAVLPAATAAAAGVRHHHPHVVGAADPAALPAATPTTSVSYRWVDGRWQRA